MFETFLDYKNEPVIKFTIFFHLKCLYLDHEKNEVGYEGSLRSKHKFDGWYIKVPITCYGAPLFLCYFNF